MKVRLSGTKIRPFAVVLALLLLYCVIQLAVQIHQQSASDYATYWFASTFINSHPGCDIYSAAGEREMHLFFSAHPIHRLFCEEFENTQTPFFYWLIGLTKTGDVLRDTRIFQTLSMGAFGFALLYFFSRNQVSMNTGLLLSIYALAFFPPLRSDVANANTNRLLLSIVAFNLLLAKQSWRATHFFSWVFWGMAVTLKPTIIMAPCLLFCSHIVGRQFRLLRSEAFGFLTGLTTAFLTSSIYCSNWTAWHSWLVRILSLPLSASPLEHFNFSLPQLCFNAMNCDISRIAMLVLLPLSFLAPLIIIHRALSHRRVTLPLRTYKPGQDLDYLVVCIGLLIYLLWSPLVWVHYNLLCLPLLIFLVQRNLVQQPLKCWGDFLKAGCTGVAVFLLSYFSTFLGLGGRNTLLILGSLIWSGTAILFALGLIHLPKVIRMDPVREPSEVEPK